MKAIRSNRNISPHGGAVPILKKIKEFGIPQVIRKCLGKRVEQSKYGYEDIFISWVLTSLCGGTRLDHITKLKKKLSIIPGLKLPSHDTLGRVMKALATETETKRNISTNREAKINFTYYNHNLALNKMLIKATKSVLALKEGLTYTLHVDQTFIDTECADSKLVDDNFKSGFSPMVCLIDSLPVFISLRNSGASAKFQVKECVEQCLNLLAENKIKVGKVISDGAGYNLGLIEMLEERGIKFNIRAEFRVKNTIMTKPIDACSNWKNIVLRTANYVRECEVADIPYTMTSGKKPHRLIVARMPKVSKTDEGREKIEQKMAELANKNLLKLHGRTYQDGNWKEYKDYKLKLIISNDYDKSPEELILEYNKRGEAERHFDFMKNDFGWRLPPFMRLNQNTVFLIAAALANNIFRGMVMLFKKEIPQLRITARLREFQFIFIDVACTYLNKRFVFYNTDIAYEKIM